jgi:hypothetical protein
MRDVRVNDVNHVCSDGALSLLVWFNRMKEIA